MNSLPRSSTRWLVVAVATWMPACALVTDLSSLGEAGTQDAADGSADSPRDQTSSDSSSDSGAPPSNRKRVFFTSGTYAGNTLGGPAGADAKCALAVQARGLGGTFKAWLSDSKTDAHDRITDVSPWYSVDRKTVLFQTKAGLDYLPNNPIVLDDSSTVRSNFCYWTGTVLGGTRSTYTCDDWGTLDAGGATNYGSFGVVNAMDQGWTDKGVSTFACMVTINGYGDGLCGNAYGVLCIEQ